MCNRSTTSILDSSNMDKCYANHETFSIYILLLRAVSYVKTTGFSVHKLLGTSLVTMITHHILLSFAVSILIGTENVD